MPKDKDNKKKYNLRKSTKTKKIYKKHQDSDSDDSDSDWIPGSEDDFDLLEYQKFIQKIFPSKSGKDRVKQLGKIDKLVKKQKNKKKARKKKDSSSSEYETSEEDEDDIVIRKKSKKKKATEEEEIYDEDDMEEYYEEDDVEELKNALGENQKFNIIFTIGNPANFGENENEFMDFEDYEETMLENEEKNEIISKDNKKEENVEPDDRLFEKSQRVWIKTTKMKKKKSGTIKKCYNKKNNYDVKVDDNEIGLMKNIKARYIEKIDSEEVDVMNSLEEMKELLKLKRSKGNDAAMKKLEEYTKSMEDKTKKKKEKEEAKEKHTNVFKLRKLLQNKTQINDFKFFRSMAIEKQRKILDEVKKINEHTEVDKPHRISLLESDIPIAFKANALKKINLLNYMSPDTGEYFKIKQWVDNFMRVPFGKINNLPIKFDDGIDKCNEFMEQAKQTLDDCVYGLEDAKMQILQFIGQWISNPNAVGSAIAIKGPPGTGKTTLIKEGISKILQRPFAFLALGGATDSSFLEGHSYTYEGSQWGKIVDILIQSKCMNPLIFFDELDKISNTPKGEEITGILTHLTDTTQNSQFHDKYFSSVDFDLSKVLFIFSYNDESKVNPILKDRMYRIHTDGYKNPEKLIIAKKYLIPKIEKSVNFEQGQIIITDEILNHIIDTFTEGENGVRNLKRCIEIIFTKLNLYRLMKPNTKLFDNKDVLKVQFPYTVKEEDLKKLIKKGEQASIPFGMYV
jgi:ATP-dependent Lon protease